ncbi:MAG: hypothetical protein EA398_08045 [Deltaproteobacteria bacterium]|nr:MAG: hypothetical protein EA398_08045 [Deltaproteobacteria bacterium]
MTGVEGVAFAGGGEVGAELVGEAVVLLEDVGERTGLGDGGVEGASEFGGLEFLDEWSIVVGEFRLGFVFRITELAFFACGGFRHGLVGHLVFLFLEDVGGFLGENADEAIGELHACAPEFGVEGDEGEEEEEHVDDGGHEHRGRQVEVHGGERRGAEDGSFVIDPLEEDAHFSDGEDAVVPRADLEARPEGGDRLVVSGESDLSIHAGEQGGGVLAAGGGEEHVLLHVGGRHDEHGLRAGSDDDVLRLAEDPLVDDRTVPDEGYPKKLAAHDGSPLMN